MLLDSQGWVLASGVIGSWVSPAGAGLVNKPLAGDFGWPIWSESVRDSNTAGFSPDIAATGKITVLYGKVRALTDQFTGSPTVGAALYIAADGTLSVTSAGDAVVVAYCTKSAYNITTYYNKARSTTSVIEFYTV
jgi:hypothetical protein